MSKKSVSLTKCYSPDGSNIVYIVASEQYGEIIRYEKMFNLLQAIEKFEQWGAEKPPTEK